MYLFISKSQKNCTVIIYDSTDSWYDPWNKKVKSDVALVTVITNFTKKNRIKGCWLSKSFSNWLDFINMLNTWNMVAPFGSSLYNEDYLYFM